MRERIISGLVIALLVVLFGIAGGPALGAAMMLCALIGYHELVTVTGAVKGSRDIREIGKFRPELLETAGLYMTVIYYAGPTPTPDNLAIGSCGPTTSGRMDTFTPKLLDMGLTATIGKGERSDEVINSIIKNKSVYLCAIGGAGALASKHITKCDVIAFDDLGCESIKKLEFSEFPLIVGIDCSGGNIFKR